MMISAAMLRAKLEHWLSPHGSWLWLQPPLPQTLPDYTPRLFKLAHIALGDVDSASALVADVLLHAPADEEAALRQLVALLPGGWLSWPTAAGPADELRLGLKREHTERLLSLLGQAKPVVRIAMALHLLDNLPRDELDSWLGTRQIDERIEQMIVHIGERLNVIPPPGEERACRELEPELLDAHDPQAGRLVRRHTLGCNTCRARAAGMDRTLHLLHIALDTFFRAPLPADILQRTKLRQHLHRKRVFNPWIVAPLALLLLAVVGQALRPATDTAAALSLPNAVEVVDKALHRWDRHTLKRGVLHERVRVGVGDDARVLERWFDYSPPHRMRIRLLEAGGTTPLFDLTTDGSRRVAYNLLRGNGIERGYVEHQQVEQWMPLLQQLPVAGSIGRLVAEQDETDVLLLAQTQRDRPVLLGTTRWNDRSAYLIASTSATNDRVTLVIDRETYALLEARISPGVATTTTSRRVWQTELLEIVNRPHVPSDTFLIMRSGTPQPLLNPREVGARTGPLMNLDLVLSRNSLPVPTVLPESSALAYLRLPSRISTTINQVYESPWSTLVIESSLLPMPRLVRPPRERFAVGRFDYVKHDREQVTIVDFALDAAPQERKRLYLWHALLPDPEREQLARTILNSITLVDQGNAAQFRDRFVEPDARAVRRDRPRFMINWRHRFTRHKLEQPLLQ